ncbi:MAG: sensor histidine kinase [Lachnospirales bacterium]
MQTTILILILSILFVIIISCIISNEVTKPITDLVISLNNNKTSFNEVKYTKIEEVNKLINKFNSLDQEITTLVNRTTNMKTRETKAIYKSLMNQMNPHFLFNSLNIINCLAIEHDEDEISEYIVLLSYILQYLYNDKNSLVTIEEELTWLNKYFELMQIRFKDKFEYKIQALDNVKGFIIPKLSLQPFIENIFIHGFETLDSGGKISVNIFNKNGIVIEIKDNGKGIDEHVVEKILSCKSEGTGINNTIERFKLHFGDKFSIEIKSSKNEGTAILIKIAVPLHINP